GNHHHVFAMTCGGLHHSGRIHGAAHVDRGRAPGFHQATRSRGGGEDNASAFGGGGFKGAVPVIKTFRRQPAPLPVEESVGKLGLRGPCVFHFTHSENFPGAVVQQQGGCG